MIGPRRDGVSRSLSGSSQWQFRGPKPQSIEPQSGQGAENNPEATSFRGRGLAGRSRSRRRGRAKKGLGAAPVAGLLAQCGRVSVVDCGLKAGTLDVFGS